MKIKNKVIYAFILASLSFTSFANHGDTQEIKNRLKEVFVDRWKADYSDEEIKLWMNNNTNGGWADINYKDTARAGWEPDIHLRRMVIMAVKYNDNTSLYYHDSDLADKLEKTSELSKMYYFTF